MYIAFPQMLLKIKSYVSKNITYHVSIPNTIVLNVSSTSFRLTFCTCLLYNSHFNAYFQDTIMI